MFDKSRRPSLYLELTRLIYDVRRICPRLSLVGASVANPRYPLPEVHLELMAAIANDTEGEMPTGSRRSARLLSIPPLFVVTQRWLWCLLAAVRDTLIIMYLKIRLWPLLKQMGQEPADVVMKTWCFGPGSLNSQSDFYYGMLPHLLEERGVSYLLLCGDLGGGSEKTFVQAALRRNHIRSVPERVLVPAWAPLVTAYEQMLTSFTLRRLARDAKERKIGLIYAYACLDCLSPSTTRNTLYFYIARAAVKIWCPKVFLTLYEGQPWEIPAWHGAKVANKNCVIAGYQHAVIMPYSFSVTWPNQGSWELSAPDVVLCLNEATRNMMKTGHEAHGTKLIRFGSLRRNSSDSVPRPPMPGRQTILILPIGIVDEAKLLFNFAMRLAPLLPDHRFIFRCHPLTPFARIRPLLGGIPEEFPNIQISNYPSMEDDFTRSSAVLYRGSSTVLYAVLHGMKPIYLHDDDHPDVDPLFEVTSWRESVSSTREMEHVLRRYAETTIDCAYKQWRSAMEYVDAYTTAVDENSIGQLLKALDLSGIDKDSRLHE